MSSGGGREGSLSGCIWRLPAGSLIGTAGREAAGSDLLRGFFMGALVGFLSTGALNVVISTVGAMGADARQEADLKK